MPTNRKMDRDLLQRRWNGLDLDWESWRSLYQDLTDFVLPYSGRYFESDRNQGRKRYGNIYDNTATRAINVLAAGLMSGMSSPARPWFRLQTADQELNASHAVKLWLDESTRRMLDLYQRTNVYGFLHQMYMDLAVYGTAATFLLDDFENIFHGQHLVVGEYRVAANYRGEVDTIMRRFEKTVGQVVKEFGYENCIPSTRNLYDNGELDSWIKITHLVEPNADRDPSKKDNKNMAWKSWYQEDGADTTQWLRKSGFVRFPALVARWSVYGGDIYGNSPAMAALGDIKQLQHEQLRKAEGIDYQTRPPLQVPSALANRDVQMLPGGVTFYDSAAGPQSGIRSMWDVNLNLQYLLQDIQDVRQRINAAFYADIFLMLQGDTTQMTATEVAEKKEEKLVVLGPTLERLHDEVLSPLVEYTFDRMLSLGLLPEPPEEMQGQELNVEMLGLLAQAQRAVGVNGTNRFVAALGQVAQFKPEILDKFNSDEFADIYADQLGVDPRMLVDNEQVAAMRQQRAQAQAQQQQLAAAQQMGGVAKDLGSINTAQPSALTDLIDQFQGYSIPTGA